MTSEQREAFFEKYGCYPILDEDVPEQDKVYFTEEQISESLIQAEKRRALAYLTETDWYITRSVETGKPVPESVLVKRAEARALLN